MNLRESGRGVAGKAERRTEGGPIRSAEDVGVFNEHDGLALARNASGKEGIQIVNCGQVCGYNSVTGVAERVRKGEFRGGLTQMVHRMRAKIVERDNSSDDGSERDRDSRIADIANMLLTVDVEVVNFGLEGLAHVACGAGEINQHAAGIDHVHAKTLRRKPGRDDVEIGLRQTELFSEFLRSHPVMEIG